MEKRIRLQTHSVNIQWIGQPQAGAPVLVFLHEALGSVVQWKTFPHELCRLLGLPGVVPERRGHGKSDPIGEPRTAAYLHDYTYELKEVLDELLPVGTPIVLVGHSDGGTIALLYARLFPQHVKAVVTMAAHTFVEPETLTGIAPAVEAFEAGKLKGLYAIHGDKTDALFYAWANTWNAAFFRDWDIRMEIRGITPPLLVLQGNADQYGTEAQVQSIVDAAEDATALLLPNCGHHPHIEKTAQVIEAIVEWLAQRT